MAGLRFELRIAKIGGIQFARVHRIDELAHLFQRRLYGQIVVNRSKADRLLDARKVHIAEYQQRTVNSSM